MDETQISYIHAIRCLQHHPGNLWQKELQVLQARAEAGEDITVEVIDLVYPNENVRRWMDDQTSLDESGTKGAPYQPLPGKRMPVDASYNWLCALYPKCTESLPVIQEGEDPPICEVHKIAMVRGKS